MSFVRRALRDEGRSLKTAGLTPRSSWEADTPGPSLHPRSAGTCGLVADSAGTFQEACSVVHWSSLSAGFVGGAAVVTR